VYVFGFLVYHESVYPLSSLPSNYTKESLLSFGDQLLCLKRGSRMPIFDAAAAWSHGIDMTNTSPTGEMILTSDPNITTTPLSDNGSTIVYSVQGRTDGVTFFVIDYSLGAVHPDGNQDVLITALKWGDAVQLLFSITDLNLQTTRSPSHDRRCCAQPGQ
jgi:hypothetical protein